MTCNRTGVSPSANTKLQLFAESAGFCQNPGCLRALFVEGDDGVSHIAEMAHIIAASEGGPRGDGDVGPNSRALADNFVLLCPACHTEIDKAPVKYPVELIREWKGAHRARIEAALGAVLFDCRESLRAFLEGPLSENAAIFRNCGPDNDYRFDPESDQAAVWMARVRTRILPNNRRLLLALDRNRALLTDAERATLEEFRLHLCDLERRHLLGEDELPAARFPPAMQFMGAT